MPGMSAPVTVHSSTTIGLVDPLATEWFADEPDGTRHAFASDRTFRRSLCDLGIRWTVRFREHGGGYCLGCQDALKTQIRRATDALLQASAGDQRGDHYYRPEVAR